MTLTSATRAPAVAAPAPSPAVATPFGQAKRSGLRVEIAGDSTASSDTYALPDGNFETTSSAVPINYQPTVGAAWVPINNNLTVDSSASFAERNTAGGFSAEFPQSLSLPVEITNRSVSLRFLLVGATGSLTTKANVASYVDALPATTVTFGDLGEVTPAPGSGGDRGDQGRNVICYGVAVRGRISSEIRSLVWTTAAAGSRRPNPGADGGSSKAL